MPASRLPHFLTSSPSSQGLDTRLTDGLIISILGPLSVARNGTQLQLGGAKQRRLLALLALHRGVPVSHDSVVDILGGDQPPRTAAGLVQTYISRLRHILWPTGTRQLSGSILAVDDGGYKLLLHAEQLDSVCFEYLIQIAQWCAQANFHTAAFGLYGKALSLWREEPLRDVEPLHEHPSAVHLRRQWADAVSGYALAGLTEGWYADIIPSLYEFCRKDEANELARALLMKALAGCGRQAAALKEFGDIRTYLDHELGVLPGRALNEAHLAVLHQSIPPPRLRQPEVAQGTAAAERGGS